MKRLLLSLSVATAAIRSTSSRSRGYVALYRNVAESDIVFILAIRAQREAGHESP